jgi:hypothetical protein
VRGSSNRPALIRVTGTADWAGVCTAEPTATSSKTNDMPSFRFRLTPLRDELKRLGGRDPLPAFLLHTAVTLLQYPYKSIGRT